MNNSKVAIAVSKTVSIIQMISGIAFVFMFGICIIMYLTDKEFSAETGVAFLIFCLVFDALGIWLITLSRKKSKLMKEFKRYVAVVSADPDGYIPDIAAALGTSQDVVQQNLELMIKKKYFANAYIDRNSGCIVIANKQNAASNAESQPKASASAYNSNVSTPTIEMVTVKCKGCGGINTIQKGTVGECDYCGSSIKGE